MNDGGIRIGYGVSRQYLSLFEFSCSSLWLFSDPYGTDVSQKYERLESVSLKCTVFEEYRDSCEIKLDLLPDNKYPAEGIFNTANASD